MTGKIDFDCYADSYEAALAEGLAISGEGREYFARGRVTWLAACLRRMSSRASAVIDFGCGTGSTSPLLFDILRADTVVGLDPSVRSIEVAERDHGAKYIQFLPVCGYQPVGIVDLVYCNGVFHHIPPRERLSTLEFLYRTLRPGGLLSLWENNPWNIGTQYIMARLPFDRDAVKLSAIESRNLARSVGFTVLRTDFSFFFPRSLKIFRPIEKLISSIPLGAQYQVLCQRPIN
jgi:SAM-dependent methyltransferase